MLGMVMLGIVNVRFACLESKEEFQTKLSFELANQDRF